MMPGPGAETRAGVIGCQLSAVPMKRLILTITTGLAPFSQIDHDDERKALDEGGLVSSSTLEFLVALPHLHQDGRPR